MEFRTTETWDDELWDAMEDIYIQAFPYGRKSERIVKKLFSKRICFLHVGMESSKPVAMALTAKLEGLNALLIDYIAVENDERGQGKGTQFVELIKDWANHQGYDGIVIEVESEGEREPKEHPNMRRVRFWERCGFHMTDYIHDYKVVPELYRAMYYNLNQESMNYAPYPGETLFLHMGKYHKAAWGGK